MKGKINLILGCMYSGKTTELIRRYNRYTLGNKKCIMIKYKGDIRYDENNVITHNGVKVKSFVCYKLEEFHKYYDEYDVICIDEIQFYEDGDMYCDLWAEKKIIEACGLNGTFERKQFPIISKLIPLVYDICFLRAVCKENGNDAIYSKRIGNNKEIQLIGGEDLYIAVDRDTYS
jgi:thymidine kinase